MGTIRARGFTLLELLIVVSIIGIMTAIAIPAYQDYVARGETGSALASITPLKTGIEAALSNGVHPSDLTIQDGGLYDAAANPLGTVSIENWADSGDGDIVFTLDGSASPRTLNGVVSLHREGAFGTWSCLTTGIDPARHCPRNCTCS